MALDLCLRPPDPIMDLSVPPLSLGSMIFLRTARRDNRLWHQSASSTVRPLIGPLRPAMAPGQDFCNLSRQETVTNPKSGILSSQSQSGGRTLGRMGSPDAVFGPTDRAAFPVS